MIVIKYRVLIVLVFSFLLGYLIINFNDKNASFSTMLYEKTNRIIRGKTAPRGRILDCNGNVLVDNILVNNLVFYYVKGIDIIEVVTELNLLFKFESPSEKEMINWYKATNNINNLITKEQWQLINERKLDKDIIVDQKIKELLNSFSDDDKNCAKIYSILTNGYLYTPKTVVSNLSDEIIAQIINDLPKGIIIESSYERYYPYGNVLKEIYGKVGSITKENKTEYLEKGYNLDDQVGLSYLEKYYDDYLKGTKATYQVNNDYSLTKLTDAIKGNDLYLSIDINLQIAIEKIVEKNLNKAKNYPNTEYLHDSYVIISNPTTGQLIAMVGKRYMDENTFNDVVINNVTSSYTMGSAVKGATISVGFKYNLFDPSKHVYDSCVKLKNQMPKCSWQSLGYVDAVNALKYSSNYYHFLIAISLAGKKYVPNMELNVSSKEFDVYREVLTSYGLGVKTGIDLPNEKTGLIGSIVSDDLLLNLAIGQYDTYTPIELLTYINTLADYGNRRAPSLVSKIVDINGTVIYQNDYDVIDKVELSEDQFRIIHKGFYEVMKNGTGIGTMNRALNPAGKTGTSESFIDSNFDKMVDTKTITSTMVGFFPYENPQYSMIVVSPHVSHNNGNKEYIYLLTGQISREITDFMFENIVIP